jgi:hypothetical protein
MVSSHTLAVGQKAKAIYETRLRAQLEASHANQFVAIEPESGEYFLGSTLSTAIQAARRAFPDRISFVLRVGHDTAVHLGVLTS